MTDSENYVAPIECGAMTDAPVYEGHKRGRNWMAIISANPTAPGGLERQFVPRAHGKYFYPIEGLAAGQAVEFGADYYSAGGRKHPSRWYGVIVRISADQIEIAPCESGDAALEMAAQMQAEAPTISRQAMLDQRDALLEQLAEIDRALGQEWVVVERNGVRMVAQGDQATVYFQGSEIYRGEFYAAGRICNAKIKEMRPRWRTVSIALADATLDQIWHYAVRMYDAGYYDYPRTDEDMRSRAETYRKFLADVGETTITYDVIEDQETGV